MQRTISLTRGQVLWRQGEPALTLGVVKAGKLVVRTSNRIVGVLTRRMVMGEAALASIDGGLDTRTHTIQALEEGTEVTEYPATLVKQMLDQGQGDVAALILRTLVGQISRNWTMIGVAHKGFEHLETPIRNVTVGLLESLDSLERIQSWAHFLPAFRMMLGLRDLSEDQRAQLVPSASESLDGLMQASTTMRWLFRDRKPSAHLDAFLSAEEERRALEEAEG